MLAYMEAWTRRARIESGAVFRPIAGDGSFGDGPMSRRTLFDVVRRHGRAIGVRISPTDLRRTFARLALQGGAPLAQISMSLGHATIRGTQVYLGIRQDLARGPADYIVLPEADGDG